MEKLSQEPGEEEESCDEVGEDELMEGLVIVSLLYYGVAGL